MDIVEELRSMEHEPLLVSTMNDAADEIERLRADLAAERALADRLAMTASEAYDLIVDDAVSYAPLDAALAAWRERRGK